METSCPFCEIGARRAAAHVIAETPRAMAFLDLHPVAEGHTLVVPRRHVGRLCDLRPDEGAEMFGLASRVSRSIRQALAPAVNLHLSDGVEADQDIPHVHLHVIPRHPGDQVSIRLPAATPRPDLAATVEVLRGELHARGLEERA